MFKKSFISAKSVGWKLGVHSAVVCVLIVSCPVLAQWPERSKPRPSAVPRTMSPETAPGPKREAEDAVPALKASGWSIVLESHSGAGAMARAQSRLSAVSSDSGRSDAFVRATSRGAAIVAGAYGGPEAAEARADLALVRGRLVDGNLAFSQAFFAPPREAVDPGQVPEVNLLSARQVFGRGKEYTLQIGFYQSKKSDDAKRAAEQAALQLRREGELAFYYHGPTMSVVTVGVFGDGDFDQGLRPKNAAILALQERYPLNLHNGEFPVIEKRSGLPDVRQPSQLVKIP